MHELHELKKRLCDELEEYGTKKLDAGSLDVIDKLAHTIKNLDKIIENYSNDYSGRTPYYDNYYGDGMSYERGRSNTRRDSMGRYSRDSRMMNELRELMNDAPDERTKMEFKKFIQKMETME